jgi:hypothetical protein
MEDSFTEDMMNRDSSLVQSVSEALAAIPKLWARKNAAVVRHADSKSTVVRDRELILSQYWNRREAGRNLFSKVMSHVPTDDLRQSASALGMFVRGTFVFDSEHEMAVVQDYLFHSLRREGETAVERLQRSPAWVLADAERAVLESSVQVRLGLLLVDGIIREFGVEVTDLVTGWQGVLVDVNFSHTAQPGMLLVSHIVPLIGTGCWMSTGAMLPLSGTDAIQDIYEYLKRLSRKERDFHTMSPERRMQMETFIIRTCLKNPGGHAIAYAGRNDDPAEIIAAHERESLQSPSLVRRSGLRKIGRNEPCPCGSGEKYKRCCGSGIR